jgi:hypothetical protein
VNQQPIVIGCYLASNECFAKLPEMEVGPSGPGCLTSEDEERETWTAESLRVSMIWNPEVLRLGFSRHWGWTKDFGGTRFKGYTIVVRDVNRRR